MTSKVLVTDTHPLVRYMTREFSRLPKKVLAAFEEAVEGQSVIFVPAVVLWELSLLTKAGSIKLSEPLEVYVAERFFAKAISILDIETEDILRSHSLLFSKDPFDTLIVSMALRLDCPLITGDGVILKHKPCSVFWS